MSQTRHMREVTWGEALAVAGLRCPRGLQGAVERIHDAVGPLVGTRNTFAKLMRLDGPDELRDRDRFRAWLLLAAFGEEPNDWGLDDGAVPGIVDRDALRAAVLPRLDSNQQPSDYMLAA